MRKGNIAGYQNLAVSLMRKTGMDAPEEEGQSWRFQRGR